ncbi:nucleoside ABC transporter membrane protein [Saccharopolyspora erythraea NRRL 2338]|uniref:Sugar ABC transporter integral membrane protein n=2 Tax=Saccharopolyspora erythraea TaxID=1836 RepID=A4FNX0_SACEN|nr:ABC transporter permease [Saccharopolyspora erythraea]EQD86514.1 ABC transporter permease [Saccharopolyspora erythraea D]PFG99385.1 nucleoside ABC transporter membrane protein [Saccharopolyspora erythraea NRRL 2338]QRK89306.1 ABC transporter permease [Saccharopolyspora erythraea]CAM05745.1 putative sugar ABC transporter integral membrane protein [Saccharopolyspora erythraea NRRL 2338]
MTTTVDITTEPVRQRARKPFPGWARAALWVAVAVVAVSLTSYQTGLPELTASGTVQAAVRLGVPILLAGLGGLWAERAGVINIGLEGMMILGTWGGAWAGYQWGPVAGLVAAAVFGAVGGLLHAVATVTFGVNHIVSGVAINLLGAGTAKYLSTLVFEPVSHNPRESPPVPKFDTYSVQPLGDWLQELEDMQRVGLSDVAGVLGGLVTGLSPLTVLAFLLVPVSYLVLWRSPFGLRLRSCGENPVAAESLGVNVYRYKYLAVIVSGALAGIGGAALILNPGQAGYLENQTNNRGYIGLAAMIFGNWRPGGLLGGAALFGYSDGLQLRSGETTVHALFYAAALVLLAVVVVQIWRRKWFAAGIAAVFAAALYSVYWFTDELPEELTAYTPHLVTLIVLAAASQRLRPPAANGLQYRRGTD